MLRKLLDVIIFYCKVYKHYLTRPSGMYLDFVNGHNEISDQVYDKTYLFYNGEWQRSFDLIKYQNLFKEIISSSNDDIINFSKLYSKETGEKSIFRLLKWGLQEEVTLEPSAKIFYSSIEELNSNWIKFKKMRLFL